jgi:hypothetical protein
VIAIDGKSIRNSHHEGKKSTAIHMVSALAVENNLCLGQVATVEKSNEITAIPELLSLLDIEGDIISLDAMGCQRKIAEKIIERGADYILAVKGNQGLLEESIKDTILFVKPDSEDVNLDCGHGRIETLAYRYAFFEKSFWIAVMVELRPVNVVFIRILRILKTPINGKIFTPLSR